MVELADEEQFRLDEVSDVAYGGVRSKNTIHSSFARMSVRAPRHDAQCPVQRKRDMTRKSQDLFDYREHG